MIFLRSQNTKCCFALKWRESKLILLVRLKQKFNELITQAANAVEMDNSMGVICQIYRVRLIGRYVPQVFHEPNLSLN